MSMLSAQCDELRELAGDGSMEWVAGPVRASVLREAADTIDRLDAENAKLRELAAILCHCMQVHASCDECRINGHKGELARDPLCACDSLHEMLRELGIEGFEVDG